MMHLAKAKEHHDKVEYFRRRTAAAEFADEGWRRPGGSRNGPGQPRRKSHRSENAVLAKAKVAIPKSYRCHIKIIF
jgi:hypothetical protein